MDYRQCLRLLELEEPYSAEKLKMKYRKLAFANHPDRFVGSTRNEISEKNRMMSAINAAYQTLSEQLGNQVNAFGEDILTFDFNCVVWVQGQSTKCRPRIHPDHRNESYRNLYWAIHGLKNREGLALRCWEKAIFQLLPDLKRYPDIDGIVHDYIRDCSSLMLRLGLFRRAFELAAIAVRLNCRSYYRFAPPTEIVYMVILRSSRYRRSVLPHCVQAWEDVFLGKVLFDDIRVHRASRLAL